MVTTFHGCCHIEIKHWLKTQFSVEKSADDFTIK